MSDDPLAALWPGAFRLAWWLCGDVDTATAVVVRASRRSYPQARRYLRDDARAAWFTGIVLAQAEREACLGPLAAVPFRQRAAWALLEREGWTAHQVGQWLGTSVDEALSLARQVAEAVDTDALGEPPEPPSPAILHDTVRSARQSRTLRVGLGIVAVLGVGAAILTCSGAVGRWLQQAATEGQLGEVVFHPPPPPAPELGLALDGAQNPVVSLTVVVPDGEVSGYSHFDGRFGAPTSAKRIELRAPGWVPALSAWNPLGTVVTVAQSQATSYDISQTAGVLTLTDASVGLPWDAPGAGEFGRAEAQLAVFRTAGTGGFAPSPMLIEHDGAPVPFESQGLVYVGASSLLGDPLPLPDGSTAFLELDPGPTRPWAPGWAPGDTVPLYRYDHAVGRWVERAQGTWDGLRIRGALPELGWWSVGGPVQATGCVDVMVQDANGGPLDHAVVRGIGVNGITRADGITDDQGRARLIVPADTPHRFQSLGRLGLCQRGQARVFMAPPGETCTTVTLRITAVGPQACGHAATPMGTGAGPTTVVAPVQPTQPTTTGSDAPPAPTGGGDASADADRQARMARLGHVVRLHITTDASAIAWQCGTDPKTVSPAVGGRVEIAAPVGATCRVGEPDPVVLALPEGDHRLWCSRETGAWRCDPVPE